MTNTKRFKVALLAVIVFACAIILQLGDTNNYAFAANKMQIKSVLSKYYLTPKAKIALPVAVYDDMKVLNTKCNFKSSNKKVVTVTSSGKLTAKKKGKATITVSASNATSKKITVNVVSKKTKLKSLIIKGVPKSATPNSAFRVSVAASPAKTTNLKVAYKSSNKSVATVDRTGLVKVLKPGTVKITASAGGKNVSGTVKSIFPASIQKIALSPATVKIPASDLEYDVNYALVSLPSAISGLSYKVNGKAVSPSPVLSDKTLVKIPVPEGIKSAKLDVFYNNAVAKTQTLSFASAGKIAPAEIYGVTPMKFSEFFHDTTSDSTLPTTTSFAKGGTVASPELFISQGTRNGSVVDGIDTDTYVEAKELPMVDAVSTATYGDSVHFAPDGNLTLKGDRYTKTDPQKAITGITSAEVFTSFDLLANATLLRQAGKATAQSSNVLSKLATSKFTLYNVKTADGQYIDESGNKVNEPSVYKAKKMLTDGNWGNRVLINENAARDLPGEGNDGEAEVVSYGGTWGDKVTGFSFGNATALGSEFAGANYWDNFANNIYGGYVTDSAGHAEPLVFLQNLFTHRMHEDFDVAISTSYFDRLHSLKSSDTYKVTVFVDGFKDVTFDYNVKNFRDSKIALANGNSQIQAADESADIDIKIKGIDNSSSYVKNAKLYKGTQEIPSDLYSLTNTGSGKASLRLLPGLFTGSYQGAYSLKYETTTIVSKALSFNLVNPVSIKLSTDGINSETGGYTEATPLSVTKGTDSKVHFIGNDDFAKTIVTSGRSGFSTIQQGNGNAVAIGAALKRDANDQPYYIDLTNSTFAAGNTYVLTIVSPGFNTHTYHINVN